MAVDGISSGIVPIMRGDLSLPVALSPTAVPALPPVGQITPGAPALPNPSGFPGPGADLAADLAADFALLAEGAGGDYLPADAFSALAGASRDGGARDSVAMQDNQVFLSRQLVWQTPDAAVMAASWRVMLKTYGEQRAAVMDMAGGQHLPSSLFMADDNPAVLRDAQKAALQPDTEAWRFVVYGWGGQKMSLRLLAGEDDEAPPEAKRRRTKVALRMELQLPESGRVMIQMEPLGDAILLDLASAHAGALQLLRALLPELAELVGRAGLRIARCRIGNELQAIRVDETYSLRQAAATLSLGLFQAMADIALRLSRPPGQEAAEPA